MTSHFFLVGETSGTRLQQAESGSILMFTLVEYNETNGNKTTM